MLSIRTLRSCRSHWAAATIGLMLVAAAPVVAASPGAEVGMVVDGVVKSEAGGFQFPDGSVQESAATESGEVLDAVQPLSVTGALYDNRVPDFTHAAAFIEVCFKGGEQLVDENDAGSSTAGGNCLPGDVGFIMEREERPAAAWYRAKSNCLKRGMRLPETFEYKLVCWQASSIGIVDMENDWEWASNQSLVTPHGSGGGGSIVPLLGGGSCRIGHIGWIARADDVHAAYAYRCVR